MVQLMKTLNCILFSAGRKDGSLSALNEKEREAQMIRHKQPLFFAHFRRRRAVNGRAVMALRATNSLKLDDNCRSG